MPKVLFLDFDGVLNSEAFYIWRHKYRGFKWVNKWRGIKEGLTEFDPKCIKLLNSIVQQTGCAVVVSSTWRFGRTVKELNQLLHNAGFKYQIMGKTGKHASRIRGEEVKELLINRPKITKYAILDDDKDSLPEQLPNFFKTSWLNGLTKTIAKQVIKHLNTTNTWNT